VEIYDTDTGELRQTLVTRGYRPFSAAYSPDGNLIAIGIQHTEEDGVAALQIWDLTTGQLRHAIPGPDLKGEVVAVAFSPDGKTLAAGGLRGSIRLLDPQTGALRKTLPEAGPRYSTFSLAYSPDGKRLASVAYPTRLEFSGGGNEIEPWLTPIRIWNPETGELERTLKTNSHRVNQLAFAADGKTLAAACDFSATQLWNVTTGELESTLGGGWWMHPHDIQNFRVEDGQLKGRVTGPIPYLVLPLQHVQPDEIREVRIRMRVTGKGDGTLWWCTAASPTFGPEKRMQFQVAPDGEFHDVVVPVSEHALWKGQEVFTIKIDPNHGAPGTEFAIASVVGVGKGEHVFPLKIGDGVERGLVRTVAFTPDSRVVVNGSWGVLLWDRATGRRLGQLPAGGGTLRLSASGKLLAAEASAQKVGLWRLK
jgi:WD40 repeat protein